MRRTSGLLLVCLLTACTAGTEATTSSSTGTVPSTTVTTTPPATDAPATTTTTPTTTSTAAPTSTAPATTSTTEPLPAGVTPPPEWLGTRPLPTDDDGVAAAQPTPPELSDRRFVSPDHLPPPPDDRFHSSRGPVPDDVLARSTWSEDCPVSREELSYITVSFWGFDERTHTGELLIDAEVSDDVIDVFADIFEARFPIEEMVITSSADLDAEPTGDGNVTAGFVCRPVTGGTTWSQHALGLAIDINPFHNPYVREDRVLPELATDYVDRERDLPGMIHEGDAVVAAFDSIGWHWGGRWTSLKDWQHFSLSGN